MSTGLGEIILYRGADGGPPLDVRLERETVWLNQRANGRALRQGHGYCRSPGGDDAAHRQKPAGREGRSHPGGGESDQPAKSLSEAAPAF